MPGRKKPKMTESERDREYRVREKRGAGETVSGEGGEELEDRGGAGRVAREREEWQRGREEQA